MAHRSPAIFRPAIAARPVPLIWRLILAIILAMSANYSRIDLIGSSNIELCGVRRLFAGALRSERSLLAIGLSIGRSSGQFESLLTQHKFNYVRLEIELDSRISFQTQSFKLAKRQSLAECSRDFLEFWRTSARISSLIRSRKMN